MLLEGLFVPEANRLGEVAKTKGFPSQRMSKLQPCELPRPHSLFSPSEEEEELEDGERRLLSRGPWELQVGRTGVVQQGFRSPYSCSQDPAVGLQRVLGQVGQWVVWEVLMLMATEGAAFGQCHLPFLINLHPPWWGHMGCLKIASVEPLVASSFPPSHPEWAPLNLELTKACQKISFQKIMGLMGLLTNGWGFIFCGPWVWTIFPFFLKKRWSVHLCFQ